MEHISFFIRDFNLYCRFLVRAVCIKERAGNIHDFFSSPGKNKARVFCYNSNRNCLQVLLICVSEECIYIFRVYHNCHTFLRLGNRNFCSVKTCIFFRNFIKIYFQSCRKLADGYRDAACTEVITFFDHVADFFSSEHTLDLTLSRRISLLYLRSAHFDGSFCMYFGRTGCAADSITSCTSSQKNDNISRIGVFTDNGSSWSCAENCTDLHTFCNVIRVIDFFYIACCKSDLVSVGAVAVGCASYQFFLGKLAF